MLIFDNAPADISCVTMLSFILTMLDGLAFSGGCVHSLSTHSIKDPCRTFYAAVGNGCWYDSLNDGVAISGAYIHCLSNFLLNAYV